MLKFFFPLFQGCEFGRSEGDMGNTKFTDSVMVSFVNFFMSYYPEENL